MIDLFRSRRRAPRENAFVSINSLTKKFNCSSGYKLICEKFKFVFWGFFVVRWGRAGGGHPSCTCRDITKGLPQLRLRVVLSNVI